MGNNNKSLLSFEGYRIMKCSFNAFSNKASNIFDINIKCDVNLDAEDKQFVLIMELLAKDETNSFQISLGTEASFRYDTDDDNMLKGFIGVNAPAILFPYIRSYVTNVTINAGIPPVILPTMNLSSVGMEIAEKIIQKKNASMN